MSQWTIKATVSGVERDVLLDSDAQPVVYQNPANSSGTLQQAIRGVVQSANTFLDSRAKYLAQEQAALSSLPPFIPNGPVPPGNVWWLRTGFVQNVPSPYKATDMGLGVVLIWAPAGTAAPAPDYS